MMNWWSLICLWMSFRRTFACERSGFLELMVWWVSCDDVVVDW